VYKKDIGRDFRQRLDTKQTFLSGTVRVPEKTVLRWSIEGTGAPPKTALIRLT